MEYMSDWMIEWLNEWMAGLLKFISSQRYQVGVGDPMDDTEDGREVENV